MPRKFDNLRSYLRETEEKFPAIEDTEITDNGVGFVTEGGVKEQETIRNAMRKGFERGPMVSGENNEELEDDETLLIFEPEPEELNEMRPREARASDRGKDAKVTDDAVEWARDPSRHDFPGVDTGPIFEGSFDGDFDDFDDSEFSF